MLTLSGRGNGTKSCLRLHIKHEIAKYVRLRPWPLNIPYSWDRGEEGEKPGRKGWTTKDHREGIRHLGPESDGGSLDWLIFALTQSGCVLQSILRVKWLHLIPPSGLNVFKGERSSIVRRGPRSTRQNPPCGLGSVNRGKGWQLKFWFAFRSHRLEYSVNHNSFLSFWICSDFFSQLLE